MAARIVSAMAGVNGACARGGGPPPADGASRGQAQREETCSLLHGADGREATGPLAPANARIERIPQPVANKIYTQHSK